MLVAPAVIAATNMSPERRVSWPTTIALPGRTSRFAVARPSANAVVGRRSTLATPRIPSVPNRRGTGYGPLGDGLGPGGTPTTTVTCGGLSATSTTPVGRFTFGTTS